MITRDDLAQELRIADWQSATRGGNATYRQLCCRGAISHALRRERPTISLDDVPEPSQPSFEARVVDKLVLQDALASLDTIERALVVGRYVCGYRQRELARRLKMTESRASRLMRSALGKLKRSLTVAA